MPRSGVATRTAILDAAQDLIMAQGYAATSVDQILEATNVTKGAFFYHFKSKVDLALRLMERFGEADTQLLRDTLQRAERLTSDPLQQVLLLVGLYEEMFSELDEPPVGCLFASYCYESNLMTDEVREVIMGSIQNATDLIEKKLRQAAELYPPKADVDLRSVARIWTTMWEGAFVMQRTFVDESIIIDQVRHFRTYVELLFASTPQTDG